MIKRISLAIAALFLSATAFAAAPTAVVSWTPVTQNSDGSTITAPVTYNLYQGLTNAEVIVQPGLTVSTFTVTTGLTPGTTQCFRVSAAANGVQGVWSGEACVAIVFSTPGTPSQVTVVIK